MSPMRIPISRLSRKWSTLRSGSFKAGEPDAETRSLLEMIQPGGFLLFQRNIESFDQIYRRQAGFEARLRSRAAGH